MDYSKLDLDNGFVLSQKQALEYLKYSAGVVVEQAMNNGYELDYENASEILKDLMCMGWEIVREDYEWVKFMRQDMSASGIVIKEMKEE